MNPETAGERLSVTFRRTPVFQKATCGECEYEECDGSLRWQCVKCALTDAFTGHVLLLSKEPT